jgi:23S rRNA (cytosine1962-C5)-methyltransferase
MLRAMSSLDHPDRDEPRRDRPSPAGLRRDRSPRAPAGFEPRIRRGALRIPSDAAYRLRTGHPWVFRDTIGDRPVSSGPGEAIELLDPEGGFVARGLYDPDGPIAVRIVSRDPQETWDGGAILRRVRWAAELRARLLPATVGKAEGPEATPAPRLSAYRVLHGEGDFFPGVTVDRYNDYLVVHLYSAALEPQVEPLLDALTEVYKPRGIYLQRRFRPLAGEGPRDPAELVRGLVAPVELEVQEGSLRFAVDVTAPLSTGLFLDLRRGRQLVADHASGRRVLNLFSYTGALSVYAASGGAREVVSVDLAARAHARARRNLSLSGLGEAGHEFIAGDALAILARMSERRRRFDMVIIDPPAFAQSRDRSFSVQRDYRELVHGSLSVCDSGSLLCCVANANKFSLDEMMMAIVDAAGRARRSVRVVEQVGLPADFPIPAGFAEGNYLKVLLCAVV